MEDYFSKEYEHRYSDIVIDPIYGQIELSHHEKKLTLKSFLQRLKHIKQLGVAFYFYPAATHTRFEHSLGVMHIAGIMYETLTNEKVQISRSESKDVYSMKTLIGKLKKEKYRNTLRLAALLHDLGHGPFSHSLEQVLKRNPKLKITKKILESIKEFKEIKKNRNLWDRYIPNELDKHESFTLIACLKYRDVIEEVISELPDEEKPVFEDVLKIMKGEIEDDDVLAVLAQVISSEVDADRIDYLLRDTHHVGFRHTGIELYSLIHQLRLTSLYKDGKQWWSIGVTERGVLFIEGLLIARKYHYDRIATDENCRKYEMFLIRKIERALEKSGSRKQSIEILSNFFINGKDEDIMAFLEAQYGCSFVELMNEATKYNCVCESKWRDFIPHDRHDLLIIWNDGEKCKEFEEALEDALKRQFDEDFLVDIYFHGKFPTSLLMSAVPGYLFLYDYSLVIGDFPSVMIENGGIRIYIKKSLGECQKYAMAIKENLFSTDGDRRVLYEKKIRPLIGELTTSIRKQYYSDSSIKEYRDRDRDCLLLLLYAVHRLKDEIFETIKNSLKEKYGESALEDIRYSIQKRRGTGTLGIRSSVYKFILYTNKILNFSYSMRKITGQRISGLFFYNEKAYEDLQTLRAIGFLSEQRIFQRTKELIDQISWHTPMFFYYVNEDYMNTYIEKRPELITKFNDLKGEIKEKISLVLSDEAEIIYKSRIRRRGKNT